MAASWEDRAAFCIVCGAGLGEREVFGTLRKACRTCDYVFYRAPACAAVMVVAEGRKVLLVRRAIAPYKGCWGLPGGYQEYYEAPADSAVREVREETGLETRVVRLLDVCYTTDDPRKRTNVTIYLGERIGGVLVAGDDASDAAFFSMDDLPQDVAFANNRVILDRLRQESSGGPIS